MMVAQVWLTVFALAAIWLVNDHRPALQRWAPVIGLLGQPAWFYVSYVDGQWGVFLTTLAFTFAWLKGLCNHWFWRQEQ